MKKILINILDWIPILGFIFNLILIIINIIDYYKGKTHLFEGYDPNYLKAIIFRSSHYILIALNALWQGITTAKIIGLIFGVPCL